MANEVEQFVTAWWMASLGSCNWDLPNISYHSAERRGAYLYEVHRSPTSRVVVPQQGYHQILDPVQFGAPPVDWKWALLPLAPGKAVLPSKLGGTDDDDDTCAPADCDGGSGSIG